MLTTVRLETNPQSIYVVGRGEYNLPEFDPDRIWIRAIELFESVVDFQAKETQKFTTVNE